MSTADHKLNVYWCWETARQEFPNDPIRRKGRFTQLMRENGHIVPGKPRPLPCGWFPGKKDAGA